MATMKDLDRLALALPGATKDVSEEGRPTYSVDGKMFCFHRGPRPDAVDEETGERMTDVFVFRVDGPEAKELALADPRGIFFTTPHWNGYSCRPQQSTRDTARPPSDVSLYFAFISFAVSAIAATVVSKSTRRFTAISLLAIM